MGTKLGCIYQHMTKKNTLMILNLFLAFDLTKEIPWEEDISQLKGKILIIWTKDTELEWVALFNGITIFPVGSLSYIISIHVIHRLINMQ